MSNQTKTIGLLGCGWLGYQLALSLRSKGFMVNGSTTRESKVATFSEASIRPFLIDFGRDESQLKNFLEVDILILGLPPSLKGVGEIYQDVLLRLGGIVSSLGPLRVLFISSTGVYGDNQGVVDELTDPMPDSKRGQNLLMAESLVKSWAVKTTILRFGGLVGEERHPVFSLHKKRSKKLGKGPINLIHREDCIRIIQTIIDFESWGELFNGVSPYHPSKDEYYNFVCDYFGLSHLEFVESEEGKKVDSVNLERKLKYKFIHRDLEPGLFKFL